MFITVTPNPSFDKTLHVDSFERGGVERVSTLTIEAGGKGINVARALAQSGAEATAIMPASLTSATEFAEALGSIDGFDLVAIDARQSARTSPLPRRTGRRPSSTNQGRRSTPQRPKISS